VGNAYVTISLALTGTLWLVAIAHVVVTRERLGLERQSDEAKSATAAAPPARASMGPAATSGA
jgi:hypothetical protein